MLSGEGREPLPGTNVYEGMILCTTGQGRKWIVSEEFWIMVKAYAKPTASGGLIQVAGSIKWENDQNTIDTASSMVYTYLIMTQSQNISGARRMPGIPER